MGRGELAGRQTASVTNLDYEKPYQQQFSQEKKLDS
jgi:hypothetical protein